jgi:ferredoxin--NADP+ reductase
MSTLNVAVVGSGPAGMYLVEALHKLLPRLAVDVIERLPTPFGLVRSGVAPDHASVRAIAQRFEQVLDRPGVRFAGGVEVGRDIGLTHLRELYDVVVLAHGCPLDKALGIPGEHLPGVWGSARFTGWYNAHPDHAGSGATDLPRSVIVLGNGNVAIDVARLLTKSQIDLAATDMHPAAVQVLGRSNVQKVMLVGRRAPIDARFSVKELKELADVANVSVALPAGASLPTDAELDALPPAQGAMLRALRTHATNHSRHDRSANIEFQFLARPAEVLGAARVEGMRFERMVRAMSGLQGTGQFFDVACGAVVSCIGFRTRLLAGLRMEPTRGGLANDDSLIDANLYCTGWARRGPSGTIATNRTDASQVARRIASEVRARGTPGPAGLDAVLKRLGTRCVDVADWRAIDVAERGLAFGAAPRRRFHAVADMLQFLSDRAIPPSPLHTTRIEELP